MLYYYDSTLVSARTAYEIVRALGALEGLDQLDVDALWDRTPYDPATLQHLQEYGLTVI